MRSIWAAVGALVAIESVAAWVASTEVVIKPWEAVPPFRLWLLVRFDGELVKHRAFLLKLPSWDMRRNVLQKDPLYTWHRRVLVKEGARPWTVIYMPAPDRQGPT